MRVFLDENIPLQIRHAFRSHEVSTVRREGWTGRRNGELLNLIAGSFDVLLTSDASLRHQNELTGRGLSVVVVPTNNRRILLAAAPALRATLSDIASAEAAMLVVLHWSGRREFRRLDASMSSGELPPMPPFGARHLPSG